MAQNTKETELKLRKMSLTFNGVKSDYAYDTKTSIVYDYNSYLAAKEMGGEPLVVGKVVEKDGKSTFVKMSAAMAESSASVASATAAPSTKPKKPEGGVAVGKESSDVKKKSSGAVASLAPSTKSKDE